MLLLYYTYIYLFITFLLAFKNHKCNLNFFHDNTFLYNFRVSYKLFLNIQERHVEKIPSTQADIIMIIKQVLKVLF